MSSSLTPSPGLRSIVAATDLSATAGTALEWAQALAIDHRADLHLVHAANLTGWSTDYLEIDARIPTQVLEATRSKLEELAASDRRSDLEMTTEVVLGDPCEVILSAASSRHADLVVVGTRGERGLDYLLLGSTAQRVVQRSPCPVLTVHPQAAEKERPIRKILVATDFSPEADAALQTSLTLLRGVSSETGILLLHAYLVPYELLDTDGFVSAAAGMEQWQTAQSDVEQRLAKCAQSLAETGVTVTTLGLEGYPPEIIIDKAREHTVDLIAMGTHGRTGLSHVLLGSTAERVIHRAPCPVLTVRRGKVESRHPGHSSNRRSV